MEIYLPNGVFNRNNSNGMKAFTDVRKSLLNQNMNA